MPSESHSNELSPIKQALYEIRTLKSRVRELEQAQREPIAIVGMGLRFPGGASDAATFWKNLAEGANAVTEIPSNRWELDRYYDPDPDAPGKMSTRFGAFLSDPALFDAHFFGVSPREAISLDPQHRMALEVAWEALENAGCSPVQAAKNKGGVFLALTNSDYARTVFSRPEELDVYASTGNVSSVAAGRVSYVLGLEGPSVVLDTACSGSLVAIHLACQSLHSHECRMALAGGVNLILSPEIHISLSKAHMMAPDGQCKAFDAKADGFVRGEGCGIVVLKRLSDAIADRDHVWAVIRGTAVNQDGRSSGLTAPNGVAQEALLKQALANAGVKGEEIGYIEAHGTGTALGDPIEAHALAAVLGPGRTKENPLVVGSVKTNVGHLEAAAGVAGLIKVVLSMAKEEIPRHLHFEKMNPHIDWGGVPVEIPVQGREWKRGEKRRLAGVSSFGFSGTNAHVILEEGPEQAAPKREMERSVHLLALSGRTKEALQELAGRYAEELSQAKEELGDICYTANAGRAHFDERAVYLGSSTEEMRQALLASSVASGTRVGDREVVFLFSGQGSQYPGMGKELYETQPVFRATIDRCEEVLRGEGLREHLKEVLWGRASGQLEQTQYTQPALFAVEWGLAELWKSWGIEPGVVLGHSVGEYVAACVAGVYGLEEGLRLIAARGRLMQGVSGRGAMAAVEAEPGVAREALKGLEEQVTIAAENGPTSVVISGYEEGLKIAEERLKAKQIRVKRLAVSHGFHSPQMKGMEAEFEQLAGKLSYGVPRVKLVSSVTGAEVGRGEITASYWRRQVREAVQFAAAMDTARRLGQTVFVEIGPGTTLLGLGRQTITNPEALWLNSLRKDQPEWRQILGSLASLYAAGFDVDWEGFDRPYQRKRVTVPTYPFERQSYWLESKAAELPRDPAAEWETIRESAQRQAGECRLDLNLALYPERWAVLDQLTSAYIRGFFQSCGVFQHAGEEHSLESLKLRCAIGDSYEKLVRRWLARLVAEGHLRQQGTAFAAQLPLHANDFAELRAKGEQVFRGDRVFLDYVVLCGENLADILQGKRSPLETIFPNGDFTWAEGIYERAPLAVYLNSIARAALEGLVRSRRADALHLLEVGAGTGSTTSSLLPVLPAATTTYDFTDTSEIFANHAEQKFAAFPFVRYGVLDIERDHVAQGYPSGHFDVIVATNSLHATRDIRATLRSVHSLLAPGGILILGEVTEYLPWFDITTGLIEGWQLFEDGLRGDHPLLDLQTWTNCLQESGFDRVMTFPESGSPAEVLGQHVLIARTSFLNRDERRDPQRVASVARHARKQQSPKEPAFEIAAWLDQPAADRREHIVSLVQQEIADLLRFDSPKRVLAKNPLIDLGLDSLMAIELRNRLTKVFALSKPLTSTLVFDYPTPEAMALYLDRELFGAIESAAPEAIDDAAAAARAEELSQLDDEDVQALLMKKLQSL